MARYRKVDVRIWNDEKFLGLSDDGQLIFLFLLTHPHMTSLGAMRATIGGLAEEKGWDAERLREAFAEASSKGMAKHDLKAKCVWLPNFIKYNGPESPNVVTAWASSLDLIPECRLKLQSIHTAKDFLKGYTEGFQKAFEKAFAEALSKAMPNQEQEQEQYPEQEQIQKEEGSKPKTLPPAVSKPAKPSKRRKPCVALPSDFVLTDERQQYTQTQIPDGDVQRIFENFTTLAKQKSWAYADWSLAYMTHVRNLRTDSGHWSAGQYPKRSGYTASMHSQQWQLLKREAESVGFRAPREHETPDSYRTQMMLHGNRSAGRTIGAIATNALKEMPK